jgi:hypothetical protein
MRFFCFIVYFNILSVTQITKVYDGRPTHNRIPAPRKNIQGSHNQQIERDQKQQRAIQGHPNKTDGNPHNQNKTTTIGGKITITCKPEVGRLGRNM